MVFTSVDLPAPLSPTSATTSPALTSKSTPPSACTAPNRFSTPRSESKAPFEVICVLSKIAQNTGGPGGTRRPTLSHR
jgi:hypothetical protein